MMYVLQFWIVIIQSFRNIIIFRLRNVTLSYDLPQSLISKIRMSSARVYLSGDNLLTISRFSGMDPEVRLDGDTYHHAGLYSSNYPVPLSVVLGIDIKF